MEKFAMNIKRGDVIVYMERHVRVNKVSGHLPSRSHWIDGDVVQGAPFFGDGSIRCHAMTVFRVIPPETSLVATEACDARTPTTQDQ